MPDDSVPIPAMICHYAAYLRLWLHVTPETSVNGNEAELRLPFGTKTFAAIFGCRKKTWSLRSIEIRGHRAASPPRRRHLAARASG